MTGTDIAGSAARARRRTCWAAGAILACLAPLAIRPGLAGEVNFRWGVRIPLRDGVALNGTLYRPEGQTAPAPCVFTLTPYISQTYHDRGMYFAAHGIPFVTVDARGRGNSEGKFRPFIQEARDGYDVVEWLARQPYCNGRVSMWGGSYAGYNQWATAKEHPPHLATIVPVAAPYLGLDFPTTSRIFAPYDMQWLTLVGGRTGQERIFADTAFWTAQFTKWLKSGAAFASVDSLLGNPSPIFQEWIAHPDRDAFWDAYNPTDRDYASLTLPILTITGMYDGDQPGALTHYRAYMRNTNDAGRARHWLVIGPWDHAGTRTPKADMGGLTFGPASLLDLPQLHLDWYNWTMRDGKRPAFLSKPVRYYVTGAERWREADSLEGITASLRPFYLGSSGNGANDVLAAGALTPDQAATAAAPSDSYVYDPADTSVAALEATIDPDAFITDQRLVYGMTGRQLVYHSPPLPAEVEASGIPRLSAWITIDQPDTDFSATLSEVRPDGSAALLSTAWLRARYRQSERAPAPVPLHTPVKYEFNSFTFMSRQLKRGSRLRLVFGPVDSAFAQRNFNTGGVVAKETVKDARKVTVSLLHDAAHPSVLYLPIAAAP